MSSHVARYSWIELLLHTGLVAALTAFVQWLYTDHPLAYLRVISEDWHGEYTSALAFLVFGLCFASLAWRARGGRRWLWWTLAFGGFFVGMEELSWGQRILGISTPAALKEANLQGEITIHNLVFLPQLHQIAGYLLLAWAVVSLALLKRDANASESRWYDRLGLPLFPLPLVPWFAVTAYHFILYPMVKSDELGEFFFGLAVALLGLYSWFRFRTREGAATAQSDLSGGRRFTYAALACVLLWSGAHVLTLVYNGGLGYRIRTSAARDYPHHGMHAQSDALFEYLYAHPDLMRDDTRVTHARLLIDRNEFDRAREVVSPALAELQRNQATHTAADWNLEGEILQMVGRQNEAEQAFRRALRIAEAELDALKSASPDAAADADARARLLWTMAQSEQLRGDEESAVIHCRSALAADPPAQLGNKIRRWAKSRGFLDQVENAR